MYCILGGFVRVPVILNNIVHMVMYSYYLLSSMGPGIQRKINSYKKYITIIQMVNNFKYIRNKKYYAQIYRIRLLKSVLDKRNTFHKTCVFMFLLLYRT